MRLSLAAALFCALASPLSAATPIPVVPVAGAVATQAVAINDKNAITATASITAGINNNGLLAIYSDVGAFIYCPKKPNKCPTNGTAFTPPPAVPAVLR
ncbi:MAG TPA: hypothetical protein VG889_10675 [Rhizomicrobium sp.]|nr:hypothetical protein [Rhizomicrobium sp.]